MGTQGACLNGNTRFAACRQTPLALATRNIKMHTHCTSCTDWLRSALLVSSRSKGHTSARGPEKTHTESAQQSQRV